MTNLVLILAYLAIGLVLKRTGLMPVNTGTVLNQYVINVAVPAMILLHLPHLELGVDVLTPAIMPWVMYGLAMGLVVICARTLNWSRELTGAMMIVVPLGNTSFLGFPMVSTFLGPEALPYAVIYDQLGSFFALALIASTIAIVYGGEDAQKPSKRAIFRKLIAFPPMIALIVTLLFGQTQYPGPLQPLIENLAATLVPVVMIAVGFQLKFRIPKDDLLPFGLAIGIKLVIVPAAALAILYSLGITGLAAQATVMEAAMPFMITSGALAINAGLKPQLVAAMVGYGVILGMATIPFVAWLVQWLL